MKSTDASISLTRLNKAVGAVHDRDYQGLLMYLPGSEIAVMDRSYFKQRLFQSILGMLAVWALPLSADYQAGLDAYEAGDYKKAMKEWQEVVDAPTSARYPNVYAESLYAIAMLYWEGRGVKQDFEKSFEWLEKAAWMNHSGAQAKLGFMYADGSVVGRDYDKAFEWCRSSAQQGNVDGLYNLGICYLYGWGVEVDPTMAAQYLAAASAKGDEDAENVLKLIQSQILGSSPQQSPPGQTAAAPDVPEPEAEAVTPAEAGETREIEEVAVADPEPAPVATPEPMPDTTQELAQAEELPEVAAFAAEGDAEAFDNVDQAEAEDPAEEAASAVAQETEPVQPVEEEKPQGVEAIDEPERALEVAEEAPAEIPVVVPDPAPAAVGVLLNQDWILDQPPDNYTIQVIALSSMEKVVDLIEGFEGYAPFGMYTVQRDGKELYVLVQGNFDNVDDARVARDYFPKKIQRTDKLWIRQFGMIQDQIAEE